MKATNNVVRPTKVTKIVKSNLLQRKRPINSSKFVVPTKLRKNLESNKKCENSCIDAAAAKKSSKIVPIKSSSSFTKHENSKTTTKISKIATLKSNSLAGTKILAETNKKGIAQSISSNSFPGAIGKITLPASIQNVLRPHQKEGITFLWNCLTGTSPALKRLAKETSKEDDEDAKFNGAILADEMGACTLHFLCLIFFYFLRSYNFGKRLG